MRTVFVFPGLEESIDNMDKDVAISVINQFPIYADFAKNMVSTLKDMCDRILAENNSSQMEVISAYRKILDELSELLKKDDLSAEERNDITEKMILVADRNDSYRLFLD